MSSQFKHSRVFNDKLNYHKTLVDITYENNENTSNYISEKIQNLNKLLNNSDDEYDEYDEDEMLIIDILLIMIYDIDNNKIVLQKDEVEDEIKIFKEKLGSIWDNKINIYLSTSGQLVYNYKDNYSYILVTYEKNEYFTLESVFDDYNGIILDIRDFTVYSDHVIPKIYKLAYIDSIKFDSTLNIVESIKYLQEFTTNNYKTLYSQLGFMENKYYEKLNEQIIQNSDLLYKLNNQINQNSDLSSKLDEQIKLNKKLTDILFKFL